MRLNRAGKPQDEQPFHREIKQHESGWWLPAQAGGSFSKWQSSAKEHIDAACRYVREFDVAVQAGTHVALWAALLADKFLEVHTFEPDEVNRRCASENLRGFENVHLYYRGLGDREWTAPWYRSLSNTGKHKLATKGKVSGMVPVVTIDSLDLGACDLICLDIEGYELAALRGAEATVANHRPVILTEDLPHARWYGLPLDGVAKWMEAHGYREAERIDEDVIWVPT